MCRFKVSELSTQFSLAKMMNSKLRRTFERKQILTFLLLVNILTITRSLLADLNWKPTIKVKHWKVSTIFNDRKCPSSGIAALFGFLKWKLILNKRSHVRKKRNNWMNYYINSVSHVWNSWFVASIIDS
jgi:hypothetical protein